MTAQFRPDNLWMLLWLGAVAAAVKRPFDARRAFVVGLLVGAALAVSIKTLLLLVSAALAVVTLWAIAWAAGERVTGPLRLLGPALAGAVLVPGAFALYLLAAGAARDAVYCLFTHNVVPGLGRWGSDTWRGLVFPFCYAGAGALAWRARRGADPATWWRRSGVLLSVCAYLFALYSYWPLFTRQDLLPVLPLLVLALAAALTEAPTRARHQAAGGVVAFLVGLIVAHQAQLLREGDALRVSEQRLARVLALTRPGDPVMDSKGEAIFRPRPLYWVLEGITQQRMADGSIADDIAERLAATATPLIIADRLPDRDAAFVSANYLPLGDRLQLLGQRLGTLRTGERVSFEIVVPATYSVVTATGAAAGILDDMPGTSARALDVGPHSFTAAADGAVALVWTPALARGVSAERLFTGTDPR